MNIAIIPARGGSKRVPRKNVRAFCGRPMIAWPISAALESGLFERILVSTDDPEIAAAAADAGAEVPFARPADLADDYRGTTDVVVHALQWAVDSGWPVDAACCLYPTAAFVSADDLREARALLDDADFAFAAVRFGHPPQRGFLRGTDGAPQMLDPAQAEVRTQDLPPVFHDAGQFYWGTREAWLERRPFFGPHTRVLELPAARAWDIDRPEDWEIAEHLFAATRRP